MKSIIAGLLLSVSVVGCGKPVEVGKAEEDLTAGEALHYANGARLFAVETFGGNGRNCATCHVIGERTTLTPAHVQGAPAGDPIFQTIDSDDGASTAYALLKRDATVRIPFTLPANVTVSNPDSPQVHHNADGSTTVWVRRSTPSVSNIAFEDALMWDGREGANLAHQAQSAVQTHDQPARAMTQAEADDTALFQRTTFFSSVPLLLYANGAHAPTLSQGRNASEIRGREFFVDHGPVDATHRGLCATCHGGPLLNTTTSGNPVQPPGGRITNNLASETNIPMGHGYPELTYVVALPHDVTPFPGGPVLIPAGTPLTVTSSDPGALLTTGDPCPSAGLPLNCLLNPGTFLSLFKIPTLWGAASTAPYFHDNSAADINAVMDRYQLLFAITAQGVNNPAFLISDQDRADITAYFGYAFR